MNGTPFVRQYAITNGALFYIERKATSLQKTGTPNSGQDSTLSLLSSGLLQHSQNQDKTEGLAIYNM